MNLVGLDESSRQPDGLVGGDVELDEDGADLLGGRAAPRLVPRTEVDAVPGVDEAAGRLQSDALVRSGDHGHGRARGCCHDAGSRCLEVEWTRRDDGRATWPG